MTYRVLGIHKIGLGSSLKKIGMNGVDSSEVHRGQLHFRESITKSLFSRLITYFKWTVIAENVLNTNPPPSINL